MPIYKTNTKKDGKQGYRVCVNYTDQFGEFKRIERRTYGAQEAKLLEKQLMMNHKEESPQASMTLQELFDEYIRVKKHEVRESTADKSRRVLEYHILPDLGSKRLSKLTLPVLQKWKLSKDEQILDENTGRKLSLTTKQNIFGEFRAMLFYAVKMGYLPKNPLQVLGNFKSSIEVAKKMDYYTSSEFLQFISAARKEAQSAEIQGNFGEWNYYTFFSIAFYTGLRKGEISALQWNDITDEHLSVTRSISQKIKGDDRETAPKNKTSIRTLQLPAPMIAILNEHKERCQNIPGFKTSFKVCGGERPLRDSTVQKRNKRYATLADLKVIRIHDFRHSHASLLANEGINIQEIARRLGHSKVEITWNTYSHLYPREEERAVEILNKVK